MNIVYLYSDDPDKPGQWNSSEWRCIIPSQTISTLAPKHTAHALHARDFFNKKPGVAHLCNEADMIVIERGFYGQSVRTLLEWRDKGKTLIVDFDDAYHLMTASNPSFSFWKDNLFEGQRLDSTIQQFITNLQIVHAATVPSALLAQDYIGILPTHVLPNYLPAKRYLHLPKPEAHDGIWIGWGGSMTHWDSWAKSGLIEAMRKVLAAHPEVTLALACGDKRLRQALDFGSQTRFFDWTTHDAWPLICQQFDLGLAPLYGEYDDRRSWLKVAEYIALGVPFLCADRPPYKDLLRCGVSVVNEPLGIAWEEALESALNTLPHLKEQALVYQLQRAESLTMEANVSQYLDTYARLCG